MNNIDFKKLGDYVKIKTGKLDANASSEDGEYPFFTCSIEPLKISSYSYDCECCLVAGNGDLNVKYYNGKFDAYQRTYIIESLDKEKLDVMYLYFFLSSYIEVLRKQSIGGVIKYIKLGNLTDALIPIPELSKQKEICQNLIKAKKILSSNENLLSKYDTLIKSRFIEMFGDPVTNPKGWKKTELGNLCKDVRYGTSKPASENGKYTYLRMNNITYEGELDLTNIKSIDISEDELPKCSVRKGDILFNRTNSIELCGKTCLYKLNETMVIAGYIIRVRVNEKLNPQYVSTFFNTKSIKKLLREMAKGAVNQANINAQEVQSIQIPVPPISLQNEYESFVQQIDKSKFEIEKIVKMVYN